jgi:hypothetical protein
LTGLAVNLTLVFALGPMLGPLTYAYAQTAAFLFVLAVTATAALRTLPLWPAWRDCGLIALAALAMVILLWPLRGRFAAPLELALQIALGVGVYVSIVLAGDVARCRTGLRFWWLMRKSRGKPAGVTARDGEERA